MKRSRWRLGQQTRVGQRYHVLDGSAHSLAPPGEYNWTIRVRRRCYFMTDYFNRLLSIDSVRCRQSIITSNWHADRQWETSMSAKAAEAARVIGVLHVAAARSQQCRRCRRCCRLCCCCCWWWWWWWWCSRELFSRCVNWPHAPPPPLPPLVKNSTTARVRSQCRISDHKISGAQSRCYQRWSVRGPGARLTWLTRWLVCR